MTTYSTDPALFIFTSLTAGSSHIVTATSRLETILRANKIPFKAVDIATDEKARMLWGRRAGKDEGGRIRKLPGLVQEGFVVGDLVEIEDWNEYGELKQHVKIYYDEHTIPTIHNKPPDPPKKKKASIKAATAISAATAPAKVPDAPPLPEVKAAASGPDASAKEVAESTTQSNRPATLPMRSVADEAAQKAKEIRLKNLREKVHGKKTDVESTPDSTVTAEPSEAKEDAKTDTQTGKSQPKDKGELTAIGALDGSDSRPATPPKTETSTGHTPVTLQSPTSTAWKSNSINEDTIQSPTSGKWKQPSASAQASNATVSARRASVIEASPKEIKAVEDKLTIKEEQEQKADSEEPQRVAMPTDGNKKETDVKKHDNEDNDDEDDDDEEGEEDEEDEDSDDEGTGTGQKAQLKDSNGKSAEQEDEEEDEASESEDEDEEDDDDDDEEEEPIQKPKEGKA